MLVIDGKILDLDGVEAGYVILDDSGRVVERGKPGTLGLTEHRVVKGAALPWMVNGHTHLGDAIWGQEPPVGSLAEIVRPPHGLKHRLLASSSGEEKAMAMRNSLLMMQGHGTGVTIDFREEGVEGVKLLREAADGLSIRPFVLGRPGNLSDPEEVAKVLALSDGLCLSALKDLDPKVARAVAAQVQLENKFFSLHASEDEREPLEPILELAPSLLVHLTLATEADLELLREEKVPVAFCPRSNALFGKFPPLHLAEKLGLPFLLGTDNLMFNFPDLFREMEFSYVASRLHHAPVKPESLVRAVFLTPWEVLRSPGHGRLQPDLPARALGLRIPLRDPYYEIVARAGISSIVSAMPA